jgi:hypothetical protein
MKLLSLRASFRFLACHALNFQKNQQFQKIIKIWLTGLGTTTVVIIQVPFLKYLDFKPQLFPYIKIYHELHFVCKFKGLWVKN